MGNIETQSEDKTRRIRELNDAMRAGILKPIRKSACSGFGNSDSEQY